MKMLDWYLIVEYIIIINIRHKNQIHKAYESIEKAIDTVNMGIPIDIIAVEIKQTLENLGNITGDNVSEDIINEIFSKFCLENKMFRNNLSVIF